MLEPQGVFDRGAAHRVILEAGLTHHVAMEAVAAVEDHRLVHRRGDLAERQGRVLRPVGQQGDGIGAGGGAAPGRRTTPPRP